jgi:formate hydrogenlyase subunit 3/multisubunit Na+/H+ antiporter MnhD subunit
VDTKFLPLFVAVPMAAAFIIPLLAKVWQRAADLVANIAGAVLLGVSAYGIALLATGSPALVYRMGGWSPVLGITLVFDQLTALMALILNLDGLADLLYSVRYLDHYTGRWK